MLTLDALQPRLRQLKLSGMRDAIGARVEEARARSLDPLEFLALLLDDEVLRREADGVARRIHQAHFDEVCDLRDFDWSYNPEIPKARLCEPALPSRLVHLHHQSCAAGSLPALPQPGAGGGPAGSPAQ